MYTKFKECLLKPSRISKYVFDNTKKTIIYFIILLFLHILPVMVTLLSSNEMPRVISDIIVEKFEECETINYKLETVDGHVILSKTNDNEKGQYINLNTIDLFSNLPIIILFDGEEEYNLNNYIFEENLYDKSVAIIHFGKEKISYTWDKINKNDENDLSQNKVWFSKSYVDLGLTKLDFSIASKNITIFRMELNNAYHDFYTKNWLMIVIILIPTIIFSGIISLLTQILLISLIYKLLYRNFNLSFGTFFKLVMCCYTPCVVFNLLSIVYGSMIMYFIGEVLVVIYVTIAIKNVVITQIGNDIEEILKNQNQGDK